MKNTALKYPIFDERNLIVPYASCPELFFYHNYSQNESVILNSIRNV
jgi:hypothetical protein